jgi:hypothetical protein
MATGGNGEILLETHGYTLSDTDVEVWYKRADQKAFTREYARHHDVSTLERDLAEQVPGYAPKIYSDHPLLPDVEREMLALLRGE